MIFSLIPARGGSKGIKDKNLSKVGNLSLVLGAIKCAESSGIFDNIVVTSDSLKIKKEIQAKNAEFLRRPKSISTDSASAREVVEHFILSKDLKDDDIVVYLQPTSPFRTSKNIHEALDIFYREKCAVTSVSEEKLYYEKYLTLDNAEKLRELFIKSSSSNRQSLNYAFKPNGAIYIFNKLMFETEDGFPINGSCPYFMNKIESLDIDDPKDLEICRAISKNLNEK